MDTEMLRIATNPTGMKWRLPLDIRRVLSFLHAPSCIWAHCKQPAGATGKVGRAPISSLYQQDSSEKSHHPVPSASKLSSVFLLLILAHHSIPCHIGATSDFYHGELPAHEERQQHPLTERDRAPL